MSKSFRISSIFILTLYPCLLYAGDDWNSLFAHKQSIYETSAPSLFQQVQALGQAQFSSCLIAAAVGGLIGTFLSDLLRKFRRVIAIIIGIILGIGAVATPALGQTVCFVAGFVIAFKWFADEKRASLRQKLLNPFLREKQVAFGSAEWATQTHLQENNLMGEEGLLIGAYRTRLPDGGIQSTPLYYKGDRHLICVAASRAGKGVSTVIPNMLLHKGSALVIDLKGEISMTTAQHRKNAGQAVFCVDPWKISGMETACFNPMDWLQANDPEISDKAMVLMDSIIVPNNSNEPFWDEHAKALGVGIVLHVATSPQETQNRTLSRVRDIITGSASDLDTVLNDMLESPNHHIVRSTAARTASMDSKLLSGVLATLQSHTHFLDSPAIRASMQRSDFSFAELKSRKITIFLTIPADRVNGVFSRFLRLMIQQAVTSCAQDITNKPDVPVLFMLDEMAALGKMPVIEKAYGLLAGYGIQIWSIIQTLGQIEELYGKNWETFIGNSGVLQYYGSRDFKTAEYFSKLAGVSSVEKFSLSRSISRTLGVSRTHGTSTTYTSSWSGQGGSSSTSHGTSHSVSDSESDSTSFSETQDVVQRPLITPDELMVMRRDEALVLVENLNPIKVFKIKWYEDDKLKTLGVNLENPIKKS